MWNLTQVIDNADNKVFLYINNNSGCRKNTDRKTYLKKIHNIGFQFF